MKKHNSHRLPIHITPKRYEITIKPDLDNFTFHGTERIKILVTKQTKNITLHALDVKLISATLSSGDTKQTAQKFTYSKKHQSVTIHFAKFVSKSAMLEIEFSGVINDKLKGFYRSAYTHKGKKNHLATTQFEATDARRAFPCFDEPAHKAVFDVTLIVPNHLTAISNTQDIKITPHDEHYKVVKFAPSPKMSTYLLAFIVGDLESIQTTTKNGTIVRVFTTPGKSKQGKFALDVASRALEFLNGYFDIPYELPVLDLIAIPDFSAGAMENWGAVTFRETLLLVDEKNTPFINRQRVAEVIAHELVHQWFGNLVTMEWWTHLWLNESFADYMAYLTVDHLFPEWHFWTKFVLGEQSTGLYLDALENTHPVEVEVRHPDQIGEIFDAISYSKGASLLRMVSSYIGADSFRDGLRLYLKSHSYKNTSSIHLWEAFEKVSRKPISRLMKQWTKEPGYPVLFASINKNRLQIEQRKFGFGKTKPKQLWSTPVQCQLARGKVSDDFLINKESTTLPLSADFEFVKLNFEEKGFYRSVYDPSLLALLLNAVGQGKLSSVDELGIVRDLFQACRAGLISTDVYLESLRYFQNSVSYVVWMQIAEDMHTLEKLYAGEKLSQDIAGFARKLFEPLVKRHGWVKSSRETTATTLLRSIAVRNASRYGSVGVRKQALKLFNQHVQGKKIDSNLRAAVYGAVADCASVKHLNQMLKLYETEAMAEEKNRLAFAIMSFVDPTAVGLSVNLAFSDKVRPQDRPSLIYFGLENYHSRKIMWLAVKKNWTALVKQSTGSLLSRIITAVGNFNQAITQNEALSFLTKAKLPAIKQALRQTREQIDIANAWKQRDQTVLKRFFAKQ